MGARDDNLPDLQTIEASWDRNDAVGKHSCEMDLPFWSAGAAGDRIHTLVKLLARDHPDKGPLLKSVDWRSVQRYLDRPRAPKSLTLINAIPTRNQNQDLAGCLL